MSYHTDILDTTNVSFDGDFHTQIKHLMEYIRMSRDEVERLQLLFNDLQEIFENTWKGSKLEVFGSVVTGLALRSSDVDCLVNLPPWLDMPRADFVIEARKILQRNRKFQNIFAITKAKVPIVQFTYVPTNTHCDVSFSTRAAVKNSKLLEYLILSDERILTLMVLVKYWSKIQCFTGMNLMSSYSLTLLFLFYLQQKNILPSIRSLQQNVTEDIEDNWNTAFSHSVSKSSNNDSLYTLFGGFLKYYENFNFKKYVISLYTGTLIDREKFKSLENLPEEFELYKINVTRNICQPLRIDTMMCIQDPFNHSRNCGVSVHPKLALRIIHLFSSAVKIYESETEAIFLKKLLHTNEKPLTEFRPTFRNFVAKKGGIQKNHKHQWNRGQLKQKGRKFKQQFKHNRNQR
ncbi:poly(A) RNA polymerase cid11-like [Pieris brassicae]|uniref:PAP-associated domain-containing protein n=1 Tax=Pieris brassicae TaxID=7116 RepID=A0A9P0X4I9_PIEBR|nr:poly(A) RNA polymerase cid11-like [Pieris brassicae]CAH3974890.1 unnamed protein product [Pieris brassicae]